MNVLEVEVGVRGVNDGAETYTYTVVTALRPGSGSCLRFGSGFEKICEAPCSPSP